MSLDAGRDGPLSGFDIEFHSAVARATTVPVIASGGAALHAGRFTLQEALEAVRG